MIRPSCSSGGASGLGSATALAFARAACSAILLTDLPQQKQRAKDAIKRINAEVPDCKLSFIGHDVTSEAEWEGAIDAAHKLAGPLDILVNSAGIGKAHPRLEDITLELWNEMIDINLTGTFLGTKWGIRSMKENTAATESKSIINLSSIEGIIAGKQAKRIETFLTRSVG